MRWKLSAFVLLAALVALPPLVWGGAFALQETEDVELVQGCQILSVVSYPPGTQLRSVTDDMTGLGANPRLWFLVPRTSDFLLFDPRSEERSGKTVMEDEDEAAFICVDAPSTWTRRALGGSAPPGQATRSPAATATPASLPAVFTGHTDTGSNLIAVDTWAFTVAWSLQSDKPQEAGFAFFVSPEGQSADFICAASYDGTGGDSTVCRGGPGQFRLEVFAVNLSSWRVDVSGPPPVSGLPVTFSGRGEKETPAFRSTGAPLNLAWTTQSNTPNAASLGILVFREGDKLNPVCDASFEGAGSNSKKCELPAGEYYISVFAAGLSSWRIDVSQ